MAALACVAVAQAGGAAHALEPHRLTAESNRIDVGVGLEVMAETGDPMTLKQALAAAAEGRFEHAPENLSYGFTRTAYWFRFAVLPDESAEREWILEVDYALLDDVRIYVERPDGTYSEHLLGDSLPFAQREIRIADFAIRIFTEPGFKQHIYVRVQTDGSLQVPMVLWTTEAFAESNFISHIALGIYYGAMLIMLLFNLFIFFSMRDRSYLLYVLYVACYLGFQSSMDGLGYEFVWPTLPSWQAYCVAPLLAATVLCIVMFAKTFLELRIRLPRWNKAMSVVAGVFGALVIFGFVAPYAVAVRVTTAAVPVAIVMLVISGFWAWRAGHLPARFFVLAWGMFLIGASLLAMAKFGLLPRTYITENALQIGSLLEVVLISFALADRINFIKAEKEAAQARALEIQRQMTDTLQDEVDRQTLELRQKNRTLEDQAERLKELDKVKTRFFANVSHEFRTPLTLIVGPLSAAARGEFGKPSPELGEQLELMLRNSRRLLRLINQLLDLTRLESGRMVATMQPRDLGPFVAAVVETFRPFAASKGLEVSCSIETPARVYIDPDRMDKVLFNLLSNACKFTEEGRIAVTVRAAAVGEGEPENERPIEIEVADTGIGIRADELEHIFDQFRQADGSTTREHEGTGLGLALAKELVELHGGEIHATSEAGVGTTMVVSLREGKQHLDPSMVQEDVTADEFLSDRAALEFAELEAQAESLDAGVNDERPEARPGVGRASVLVVDDNADLRKYLSQLLGKHEVRTAADGMQALELVRERAPNLVLSDVMMPRMDGYELCAAIKNEPDTAHIPVILLTAQAGLERKLEGLAVKADDYVTKPFQRDELLARVDNLLQAELQREELRRLNRDLESQVLQQAEELRRQSRLGRFLPSAIAQRLLDDEASLQPAHSFVTAVQLEIPSFQDIAAELGAESVAALVGQFHTMASDAVFEHGGTITGLHHCTLEAIFGAPVAMTQEATAQVALDAVDDILDRLSRLAEAWRDVSTKHPLSVRGGVASGDATVGVFGEGDWTLFSAVGEPVVRASWLAGYAVHGEVLAVADTVRLAGRLNELDAPRMASLRTSEVEVCRLNVPGAVAALPTEELIASETFETGQTLSESAGGPELELEAIVAGSELGGRFRVVRRLGRGGMGAVYEAKDLTLGDDVAVKVFRQVTARDRERIHREVRLSRLVTHANVCRVFDLHNFGGVPAVTMELIQGEPLSAHLRGGRLDLDQLLRWAIPICYGLRAAHACGIVHRDLKPQNILIEDTGRPVIVDFGIARTASERQVQKFEGTLDYIAPEQMTEGHCDALSDIYSLGVVLFEMATGRLPSKGKTPLARAITRSVEQADPTALVPDLNPALAAVIVRCLAIKPQQRFQRVTDLTNSLERIGLQTGCPWRELRPRALPNARGASGDDEDATLRGEDLVDREVTIRGHRR